MAVRRNVRTSRTPARKRAWARTDESFTTLAVGTPQRTDLGAAWATRYGTTAVPPGTTVGGVLLDLSFVNNAARSAATDGIYFGIYVTSETTAASVEDASAVPDADWMWRQFIQAEAGTGQWSTSKDHNGEPFRIRAKRRMDEIGMRCWFTANPVGSTTYSGRLAASLLMILP